MELQLPHGLSWKEQGRLAWCTCCRAVVPCSNEKLLKQHLKSRTHKKAYTESSTDTQNEQQPSSASIYRCTLAPEDYQQYHLEALQIAGSYPEDSPYAGFYYTHSSCLQADSSELHSSRSKGSSQLHNPHQQVTQHAHGGDHQPQLLLEQGNSATVDSPNSALQAVQQLQRCHLIPMDDSNTTAIPGSATLPHNANAVDKVHQQQTHGQQQSGDLVDKRHQCCSRRPCWPLPYALKPKAALVAGVPFLTLSSGSIPWVPGDLEEALAHFCQPGACRLPNIDIGGINQQVKSWSHAAKLLRTAAAGRHGSNSDVQIARQFASSQSASNSCAASCSKVDDAHPQGVPDKQHKQQQQQQHEEKVGQVPVPYWASLVVNIRHPAWWPKTNHVPTYDIVIIGAGPSGIGIHRDVDHSVCHNPPPVSTYLTAVRGKKHVIVLPPDQTLFPVNDKIPFPTDPSPELLQAIKAAGGAYFDLQPAADGTPVTLYMPAGWLHWLVGAADWHVVYGGSVKKHDCK